MSSAGSNWLILGGCGFIGRNLVHHLVTNKLATKIRVADKSMPATSSMNDTHKAIFDQKDIVEFKQADLSKDDHVKRVFDDFKVDYVVNLCGETKFGLSEQEYKTKCLDTAVKTGTAAAKAQVQKFIEISTAQIYNPDKSPSNEDQKQKPWTVQAKFRLEAEQALQKLQKEQDLRLVILRPALVYGVGDLTSITPRIACAAVYQKLGEKMKFLWDKDLRLNVVHVDDVVRAIVMAATDFAPGAVYNLADQTELTQGELNDFLGKIFKIETGFLGSIVSNLAKLNLGGVAEEANDKHVPGFTKLCDEHKINNTPISAYIDKELLSNNHLSIDGKRITQQTKFTYTRQIDEKAVREQIEAAIQQGIFPKVI